MKVYKYTPHINLFLNSSSLKLTPSFQLNDPFEAKFSDEYIRSVKDQMISVLGSDELVGHVDKNLENNGKYRGIISLSEIECDIKMLSHYAENHSGGILEFTIEDIDDGIDNIVSLFNGRSKTYNFGFVRYLESRNKKASLTSKDIFTGVCFEKYISWGEEKEVRYLSDFRNVDYVLIPKKELVELYFKDYRKKFSEHSFDMDVHDFQLDNDLFRFIYKSFDYEKNEDKYIIGKPKKIRSIVGKMFENNIQSYQESEVMIKLTIKNTMESYYPFHRAFSWDRLIDLGCPFHPMLKVNPSSLTGVYLGVNFDMESLDASLLTKFENLNGNIKSALISPNDFSHELVDVL
ncbi:TPA: DUF2971 domain-containing protein [Vibrio parahaemolyticus]|uniref:DUF2971 domain-containing protein n=1 Tax=Vibrio parahaemolyticus TaxID=670 RepID=UPI00186A3BE3|nr:DUF2971 domain-containing protein [Vibrio parahaemolyticus]MBE3696356.1 DUF2971 domain-containing protein [Vibrio parahaemolyticus]MCR9808301.1 DUF2971 domain-containing protein [Vibrio parahaemolyticus]MCR9928221.1 DUF2971 domain-containing protein [Vibrio parahaemolyticus]HBC3592985.1 DUF2971 domain-containing protein [Vibrio parahaemolyticus]HBC3917465.1 DUF2971 domain-containing protein [Vibrio parahaemolyticus]